MMISSRLVCPLLLLAGVAAEPLAAQQGFRHGWSFALQAEQVRLGDYLKLQRSETVAFLPEPNDIVSIRTDFTRLNLSPTHGFRASLARTRPGSSWGVRGALGWGRGAFAVDIESKVSTKYPDLPQPLEGGSSTHIEEKASFWDASVGLVRTVGSADSRVNGSLSVSPSISVLRIPFMSDPPTYGPPTMGGSGIVLPAARTHSYVSPGASLGATMALTLGRGIALELAGSAGTIRSAGRALADDLAGMPWPLGGNGPTPIGEAQWRPVTTLAVGLAYLP
jgi:hypothetical protein